VEGNAIRATVSGRAKDKESLRAKLLRFMDNPAKQALIHGVDDVFAQLGDLAAVRVSTYFEADRERVVELLKGEFVNRSGQRLGSAAEDIEVKPPVPGQPTGKSSPNYRATHCMAYLPESEMKGAGDNLRGTPCEIQVCSLLAHVWNEIEYDLGYKPHSGELNAEERECLDELAQKTREGDAIIARLVKAAEEKLKVSDAEFKSVDDFYQRLKELVPMSAEPRAQLSELYYEMVRYGLNSPRKVVERLLTDGWENRAIALLAGLNIQHVFDQRMELTKAQDTLSMLFAAEFSKQIITQQKKSRLPETRLVKLAKRLTGVAATAEEKR
jgi:ppGpp synthetase/RelA/SpoT-type nucleotidyltranferase